MKRLHLAAAVVALPLLVAGCTPAAPEGAASDLPTVPSPAASVGNEALPPTIVSPGDLDRADTTVVVGTALVIAAPDGTEAEWSGTTDDPSIAEFSAGGASDGAVFRPGFEARKVGSTDATLTGPDGREISFRISVVAP